MPDVPAFRRRFPRAAALALGAVTAVSLAACGTTLSLPAGASGAGSGTQGLAASGSGGPRNGLQPLISAQPGSGRVTGPSGGLSTGGSSGSPGGGQQNTAGSSGAQSPSAGQPGTGAANGRAGVNGGTIAIGVRYLDGAQQFSSAFGEHGVNVQDTRPMEQAVINDINRHGGIAGRKIAPVWQPYEVTQIAEAPQQEQRNCAAWTEDSHVFAAVSPIPSGSELPICMAQHHTPFIQDSVGLYFDAVVMRETAGYFYTPDEPNASRTGRFWVDALARQGYFGAHAKIGLVLVDDPSYHRVADDVIKPELARYGLQVSKEASVGASADVASAVLQFRSAGITHVMILDDSSLVAQLWMNQAQSQGYHPKYGLNSVNAPFILQRNVPTAQLVGSVGVGWFPDFDVDFPQDPPANSATTACRRVMKASGVSLSDRASEGLAMNTCDVFWFLRDALERATQFSASSLAAAVARMGTSHVPAGSFLTSFASGRTDGAAGARNFAFATGCNCFRYTSGVYGIS